MSEPHYVRGYRRFTASLRRRHDEDQTASLAVGGGDYESHGELLRRVLLNIGLREGDTLIDVGCGSGRLSWALSRGGLRISYLGTDVVPELLAYARRRCKDTSFDFQLVDDLRIPAEAESADMITFFSVFTHLDPPEQLAYLAEARRVLKPGGMIVASYIELWRMPLLSRIRFRLSSLNHAVFGRAFKSVASTDEKMRDFGLRLGLSCEFLGPIIGQSVCIYRLGEG